jgi:hypothetical protein
VPVRSGAIDRALALEGRERLLGVDSLVQDQTSMAYGPGLSQLA